MNELQSKLVADMKAAMKAREKDRLAVIRLMIAALKEVQMSQSTDDMTLDAEQDVLRKMAKSRRDSIDQASQVNRQDIVDQETAEIGVIQEYLPKMMEGEELLAKVREVAASIDYAGPQDKGKFMKEWMSRYKGQAEGRDVQAALGELG